jgi:lipid-A-disaccharide synthase
MDFAKKTFLIIAGEPSGDLYGAGFINELKQRIPDCEIFGIGGMKMAQTGTELLHSIDKLAVMGLSEVIIHIPVIRRVFNTVMREVERRSPAAVILIDYPDFNIRLAKTIRRRFKDTVKIFYYISPQVWAWRKKRIKTIGQNVDAMAAIFPFEEELYKGTGMKVSFVGHPLLDIVKPTAEREEFLKQHNLIDEHPIMGLLPGSRRQEIERHLPVMLESVTRIRREIPAVQVVIGKAPNLPESVYLMYETLMPKNIIISEQIYNIMYYSSLVVVSSGTATLETALAGTPMIIIYKMSLVSYWIARWLVSLPYIGMANIVHGRKVVPELIQNDARPDTIAQIITTLLTDSAMYDSMRRTLQTTRTLLGQTGATGRAVDMLISIVE